LKSKKDSPLKSYSKNADPRDPVVSIKMRVNHQLWYDEIKKYGFDFADGVYAENLLELHNEQLNVPPLHVLPYFLDSFFDTIKMNLVALKKVTPANRWKLDGLRGH
jgi:hypothetical protein